jgi:hypothetical protein
MKSYFDLIFTVALDLDKRILQDQLQSMCEINIHVLVKCHTTLMQASFDKRLCPFGLNLHATHGTGKIE